MYRNPIGVVFTLDFGEGRQSPPTRSGRRSAGAIVLAGVGYRCGAVRRTAGAGAPWSKMPHPRLLRGQEHRGRRAVARRWALGRRFPGGSRTRPWLRSPRSRLLLGATWGARFGLSSPGTPASIAVCVHGAGLVPIPGVPGLPNRDTCGAGRDLQPAGITGGSFDRVPNSTPLLIGEPNALVAELLPQHAVFGLEILDDLELLPVNPTGLNCQDEVPGRHSNEI